MKTLLQVCEEIANDGLLPGRVCDWASELYDQLNSKDPKEMVFAKDVLMLEVWQQLGEETGLSLVDYELARRY